MSDEDRLIGKPFLWCRHKGVPAVFNPPASSGRLFAMSASVADIQKIMLDFGNAWAALDTTRLLRYMAGTGRRLYADN
jgi:hypothetical protein